MWTNPNIIFKQIWLSQCPWLSDIKAGSVKCFSSHFPTNELEIARLDRSIEYNRISRKNFFLYTNSRTFLLAGLHLSNLGYITNIKWIFMNISWIFYDLRKTWVTRIRLVFKWKTSIFLLASISWSVYCREVEVLLSGTSSAE